MDSLSGWLHPQVATTHLSLWTGTMRSTASDNLMWPEPMQQKPDTHERALKERRQEKHTEKSKAAHYQ